MKNNLENELPKCIKTELKVLGDVASSITYFEDGIIIVDYPEKPL
jgi:hypothetical protein